jgi:hypothetical protein
VPRSARFSPPWQAQPRRAEHKDGRVRYRLVADITPDANGKHRQLTRTFGTKKEALNELSRIRHQVQQGTFISPSDKTVDELLDIWLASATSPST